MNSVLEDEITSINAIYEEDTLTRTDIINELVLRLPNSLISLRLLFPETYPDIGPKVLGPHSIGSETRKGEAHELVDLTITTLNDAFIPGGPCIYDLLEELTSRLQAQRTVDATKTYSPQTHGPEDGTESTHATSSSSVENLQQLLALQPPWTLSLPITEKKSIFLARAARVTSPSQAKSYLQHLISTDKKAAKATHNITAWRMQDDGGVTYQDCDDDGETAAGGRLLHLMQIMDVWDVMVVVSRWYGGVQLGPDRFRIINQVARDALVRGGWVREEGERKKGHR